MAQLNVGDTIQCSSSEEMAEINSVLGREGIETEFLYQYKGIKGYFLYIEKVPGRRRKRWKE